ncbi:hypothetical protein VST7929_03036 [Vibrio stylophorae]|uniref:MutT/nudix family protein n=1 Tax=Vibrio stylophorae TaxID=659351 RepID=A0ABM8ZXG7_9VIBR|nr:hypothetical protein [Vibrio stylophorae]CAH0535462.1 hypothetical protein VST7929_03036 [Vibrio stylophorae]
MPAQFVQTCIGEIANGQCQGELIWMTLEQAKGYMTLEDFNAVKYPVIELFVTAFIFRILLKWVPWS